MPDYLIEYTTSLYIEKKQYATFFFCESTFMYLPNTTTTLLSKAKCLIAKKKEEEESEVSEKIINFLVVNDRIFPTLNKYLESMTISIQDISVDNKGRV